MLPSAKREDNLAADRSLFQVQQAGWDFGEEVEQRVGTDCHDRRYPQAEDQNGEQQNAAPHAAHADEDAHNKANQDFGCY